MSEFVLSQLIAAAAFACGVLTFQLKERTHILLVFAAMSSFLSLHFYVLGQYAACAIVAVSVVRFLTSTITKSRITMYIFLAITITVGWFTYTAPVNLLAILAGLLGVIGTFQTDDKRLRKVMLTSSTAMALHDFLVWTPVGLLVDLTVGASNIIGYYRYYIARSGSDSDTHS